MRSFLPRFSGIVALGVVIGCDGARDRAAGNDAGSLDATTTADAAPLAEGGDATAPPDASPSADAAADAPPTFSFFTYDPGIPPTGAVLASAMSAYDLGPAYPGRTFVTLDGKHVTAFGEWDYTYYKIPPGATIGDGTTRDAKDCYGSTPGCYTSGPSSKQEGYDRLHSYWVDHVPAVPAGGALASMTGHYFFQHYGARFGADVLLSEVGENIDSLQAHIAFTRGAARQYGKTWGLDFSAWYGPSFRYYMTSPFGAGVQACPTCGHSDSLFERAYLLAYMSGANYLSEEGGGLYDFSAATPDATGKLPLSPIGELAQRFVAFTRAHDRGTPFVPMAVLLEQNHGTGLGFWYSNAPWDYLTMDAGDTATATLFDQVLWPGSFRVMNASDESGYLVAAPFGDTIDVLLEDAALDVMKSYRVLLVSGDVAPTADLVARLTAFVQTGGALVLQSAVPAQASMYTTLTSAGTGAGRLYLPYSDAASTSAAIGAALAAASPFTVAGGVEHVLGQTGPASWVVTFVNDAGVTKTRDASPAVIDPAQTKTATLTWKKAGVSGASVIYGTGVLSSVTGNGFSVTVPPGGVVVAAFDAPP